jgi:TonB family protein
MVPMARVKDSMQLYYEYIQKRIRKRWKSDASGKRWVHARFIVNQDGTVRDAKVFESSGDPEYDAFALRTLAEASPFKPPPEELAKITLQVDYLF